MACFLCSHVAGFTAGTAINMDGHAARSSDPLVRPEHCAPVFVRAVQRLLRGVHFEMGAAVPLGRVDKPRWVASCVGDPAGSAQEPPSTWTAAPAVVRSGRPAAPNTARGHPSEDSSLSSRGVHREDRRRRVPIGCIGSIRSWRPFPASCAATSQGSHRKRPSAWMTAPAWSFDQLPIPKTAGIRPSTPASPASHSPTRWAPARADPFIGTIRRPPPWPASCSATSRGSAPEPPPT